MKVKRKKWIKLKITNGIEAFKILINKEGCSTGSLNYRNTGKSVVHLTTSYALTTQQIPIPIYNSMYNQLHSEIATRRQTTLEGRWPTYETSALYSLPPWTASANDSPSLGVWYGFATPFSSLSAEFTSTSGPLMSLEMVECSELSWECLSLASFNCVS